MGFKGPGEWRSQAEQEQAHHQVIEFDSEAGMVGRITLSHGHLTGSVPELQELADRVVGETSDLEEAFGRLEDYRDENIWAL
jgi:hypothetical protein